MDTSVSIPPLSCTPLEAAGVTGRIGTRTLHFRMDALADPEADHLRVQADGVSLNLERWLVTMPNRPGTYRCGDTPSTQVGLLGIAGIVGDGGAAAATATEGECIITLRDAPAAAGEDAEGCFTATLVANFDDGRTEHHEVVEGAFRAPRR
jgi:hypothetical protein